MSTHALGPTAPVRTTAALTALSLLAFTATAQTPASLDPVIVTASRSPQPLSAVLAEVSVLDRAAIERAGVASVADLLAQLPGIEFARNGGPGTATSVFIRGAETRHAAVYLDGVRIDSQSTGGAMWEQLPLDQIERIEVLRGPAAAVYGSDAVGGVVQLFTHRGKGPARPTAALTAGSRNTAQARAGVSGASGSIDYALSASQGRSDGFNARIAPTANPDRDGWRRGALHARVGLDPAPRHHLDASLLATSLRAQYDGSRASDDVSHHSLRTAALGWQAGWSESSATRVQAGESRSTQETVPTFYRTETTLRNFLIQHEQRIGTQQLTAALERREDRLDNSSTAFAPTLVGRRSQDALALGWRGEFGARSLQAHLRHDRDSEFGARSTGSLAWGWRLAPGWRATAAAATSFRAPTLYQRFSEYGVATLVPESGRNVELGIRHAVNRSEWSATLWRNTVNDLLVFGPAGPCVSILGCYQNVGRARMQGLTLAGRTTIASLTLRGSLDWHDPRNLQTGKQLARRARRLATFGADTMWADWSLGVEARAAGPRFENAANTQRLAGYALVNLVASRPLRPGLLIEGRIDNVGDKQYELARSYATAGRAVQLTMRWALP
ncbi:TonB-dependent receptor [Ramlibacter sp. RBP-2]|uniref:TonB-dependent receptor n=1 Tax=Ramlibacter lithotrophicus TaxID=2606681 RepID=A0A7X6DFY8_9BURK|nr:TonB-dependent receptor [Ramlibacter lithotrophicus]NKE66318.1 TonB-dependent receptor [Ramlibacter lithotrophicus]